LPNPFTGIILSFEESLSEIVGGIAQSSGTILRRTDLSAMITGTPVMGSHTRFPLSQRASNTVCLSPKVTVIRKVLRFLKWDSALTDKRQSVLPIKRTVVPPVVLPGAPKLSPNEHSAVIIPPRNAAPPQNTADLRRIRETVPLPKDISTIITDTAPVANTPGMPSNPIATVVVP